MQRTALMLELSGAQINALLTLTSRLERAEVERLVGDELDPDLLLSALEEFHWQLAALGHSAAIALLSDQAF